MEGEPKTDLEAIRNLLNNLTEMLREKFNEIDNTLHEIIEKLDK